MAEKEKTAGPPRVLVAAGSAAQAISFVSWLVHEGFEVMTAIDGQEALQIAGSSWQPDIVLIDLALLKVDRFSVCERMRITNQRAVIVVLSDQPEVDEIRSL